MNGSASTAFFLLNSHGRYQQARCTPSSDNAAEPRSTRLIYTKCDPKLRGMSADDDTLCREIVDIQDNIVGAGIIESLVLVAIHVRPGVPLPKQEKFNLMFAQSEVMISIAKTNTDFFGYFRYIVSSFEKSDIMFFPLKARSGNRDRILVIQVLRPCDHEKISKGVANQLQLD